MKAKEMCKKDAKELNHELINLLREQFSLRLQYANKKLKQTHLIKDVRRNISRIKTLLSKKTGV